MDPKIKSLWSVQGSLESVCMSIIQAMPAFVPPAVPLMDFLEPLMLDEEQADQYKKVSINKLIWPVVSRFSIYRCWTDVQGATCPWNPE